MMPHQEQDDDDDDEEASLGFSKITVFVSMPLAELNCTFQSLWNSLPLTVVHLWMSSNECLMRIMSTSGGNAMGDARTVCWENNGMCCLLFTSLPAQEDLASWTDMCDFRDISWNNWEIRVTNTLESVSALIHTTRFHSAHALIMCVGMVEFAHNMPTEMPFWN